MRHHSSNGTTLNMACFERTFPCQEFLVGVTDNRGEFTFPQVRAAGYGEIAYWKQGIDPAREVVRLAGPAPRLVRLTLKAGDPARLVVEADPKVWANGGLVTVSSEKTFSLSLRNCSAVIDKASRSTPFRAVS